MPYLLLGFGCANYIINVCLYYCYTYVICKCVKNSHILNDKLKSAVQHRQLYYYNWLVKKKEITSIHDHPLGVRCQK